MNEVVAFRRMPERTTIVTVRSLELLWNQASVTAFLGPTCGTMQAATRVCCCQARITLGVGPVGTYTNVSHLSPSDLCNAKLFVSLVT